MREVIRPQPERPATWASRLGRGIDWLCYAISPRWGASRMVARRYSEARLATFEGAETTEVRGNWISSRLSTDAALEEDLDQLRSRSRELYRNDSYGGTVDNVVNHVVGCGFTPQCRISEKIVGTEASQIFREELELVYKLWSTKVDISGRISLWQQTRLMERHILLDGEGLAVLSDDPVADKPIPLTVEVIDPERLRTPVDKINDPRCRMGVEKDAAGRIIAYWISRTHPGDTTDRSEEFDRVPASRVLHVFERWFAGQTRGLPWLTRAMNRIKDCKDLDEAEIVAAQIQSCFAVFVKQTSPGAAALAAATSSNGTQRFEELIPGKIMYGNEGQEPVMVSPSRPGNTFAPFQEWNYRRIAAAINWPFEMLVKNWTGLSFVAGRLILSEARLEAKSRQKMLDEAFLRPVWERMVDECVLTGACNIEPRNWAARPWVYRAHNWTPPAWSYAINPGEERKANRAAVDGNQKTLASVIAEDGEDLEEVLEQRAREMKMQRDLDILPPEILEADAKADAAEAAVVSAIQVTGGAANGE